jgi:predicted dehydrogenase
MLAAIDAGKHVLCEKPFTANAIEATLVADAANASDLVVMEAVHYVYHPLMTAVIDLIESGTIGEIAEVTAHFDWPVFDRDDIRFNAALGGGALMDLGCYPVHLLRTVAGCEPQVVSARARTAHGVDVSTRARLAFPNGVTGTISCSMRGPRIIPGARIRGTKGTIRIHNFVAPQGRHWVSVRTSGRAKRFTVDRTTTYSHQLEAFAGAVLRGSPYPTTADDAVATMRVIDDITRAAGLEPRRPLS